MDLTERYERALADLVAHLRVDRTVLAAILCGSLAYDTVWDKSDIDLVIIGDESHKDRSVSLVEDGVNIHAQVMRRSTFRKSIEGHLQSSFFHSYVSKGRLLYTVDESLATLISDLRAIGSRDRALQLFAAACRVPGTLAKAEKWLRVRKDARYSFVWILFCVNDLARIECITHGEITSREVIQQAVTLNPAFFRPVYADLIDGPKDLAAVGAALASIESYMAERTHLLFQPLLDFLAEATGPRSMTEINAYFGKMVHEAGIDGACEWLSDRGVIDKVGLSMKLSDKSRSSVNEAAYYYDAG